MPYNVLIEMPNRRAMPYNASLKGAAVIKKRPRLIKNAF